MEAEMTPMAEEADLGGTKEAKVKEDGASTPLSAMCTILWMVIYKIPICGGMQAAIVKKKIFSRVCCAH
jgi:hypothetical protein